MKSLVVFVSWIALSVLGSTSAQVVDISNVRADVRERCAQSTGVNEAELQRLVDSTKGTCVDPLTLPQNEKFLCYYNCILQAVGFPHSSSLNILFPNTRIEVSSYKVRFCQRAFPSTGVCSFRYNILKCLATSIYYYPVPQPKQPVVCFINPEMERKCQVMFSLTDEQLCEWRSSSEDLMVNNPTAVCFHRCLLEQMGYIVNGQPNIAFLNEVYAYLPVDIRNRALGCLASINWADYNNPETCKQIYLGHQCMQAIDAQYH